MSKHHSLSAGCTRRDITPSKPMFLVGYPHVERISTGINDPLFATTLCLDNGESTLLAISMDLVFVTDEWTRRCRERIARETGIPECHIMIGATHTHSGPHIADVLAWSDDPVVPPVDTEYLDLILSITVEAAVEAWRTRVPAEAAWTTAEVRGLAGGNRIAADGPEDPEAGLLLVRNREDKQPLGILCVYGMHPTVLHEDSTLYSSDFIAYTRQTMETAYPGASVVYLNGICGNQSPRRFVTAQTFAEAERIGNALGKRLVESLTAAEDFQHDLPLNAALKSFPLKGKTFPPVAEAEVSLTAARSRYAELKEAGAPHAQVRTAECTVFGAEEVYTLAKAEVSGEAERLRQRYARGETQVFRIGDACVTAWPGEFFVEYALDLKARAPMKTFPVSMANGELQGYVVTEEAEAAKGYEAQMSLFPASAGKRFVDETLTLLESLAPGGQSR